MQHTRKMLDVLSADPNPKMRNSKFLQFLSKMSNGEIILEDNKVGLEGSEGCPGEHGEHGLLCWCGRLCLVGWADGCVVACSCCDVQGCMLLGDASSAVPCAARPCAATRSHHPAVKRCHSMCQGAVLGSLARLGHASSNSPASCSGSRHWSSKARGLTRM
jgi:hypothetical protein